MLVTSISSLISVFGLFLSFRKSTSRISNSEDDSNEMSFPTETAMARVGLSWLY